MEKPIQNLSIYARLDHLRRPKIWLSNISDRNDKDTSLRLIYFNKSSNFTSLVTNCRSSTHVGDSSTHDNLFEVISEIDMKWDRQNEKERKKLKFHQFKRNYLILFSSPRAVDHTFIDNSSTRSPMLNAISLPLVKTSSSTFMQDTSNFQICSLSNDQFDSKVYKKYITDFTNRKKSRNLYNLSHIKIYRCQLTAREETCCCSCNSDAMFEVMKSLYDCYKKKDCNNCRCILCAQISKKERGVDAVSVKEKRKERLKEAKEAGFLTPLQGKSTERKAEILKGLASYGIQLPEGKTKSEKELINKVRTEIGLPLEPRTPAEKTKLKRAEAAGLLVPLEGKTAAQKEDLLRKQAEFGITLPEGRTPSEKSMVKKIKAAVVQEGLKNKIEKAKAAGFVTPLKGKTPEQKENILKGLVAHGLPLPEGNTASEKQLINKIRKELGLPPEPKSVTMKNKYDEALAAGIITPLEGKSPNEKEQILQAQANMGIPLPEGRTPSEKQLIEKIRSPVQTPLDLPIPSEKVRKAKEAGFITPLKGKGPEEKERILTGLAMHGIPLPEGTTSSEKVLIKKVQDKVGLPPEPQTSAGKAKYKKAIAAGIITPLEGKTTDEKEKTLRKQAKMGLPLPKGRTPSEKSLIQKIIATTRASSEISVPSEKMRKAKAAGLLTPLEGKTPDQKEKNLTGLAMHGIPLPETRTNSEKAIVEKIRAKLGLPPEPKTASEKEKYKKAFNTGIITPLEGKNNQEKEKILRAQAEIGLPLPKGRTPSEKALIKNIQATTRVPSEKLTPSAKLDKAKAAGFITPLEGKTAEQKEKILKGLAIHGLPLPEGNTSSEKALIKKVRANVGLPPEPNTTEDKDKYKKALAAGIITPLEGKTNAQKEKILKAQANIGLPLPEGRTPSEKDLIKKIKATQRELSKAPIPSAKLRKAKAAGLLTPLEGKSPQQKEKILTGLAMNGIPLPEGKTASEKALIKKVRTGVGLPPEPATLSGKENYRKAFAAGLITPLEGKSPEQKEKILRTQADLGLPLPEGRSPSEKALIKNVKATLLPKSEVPIPSEKLRKAKAAGLLTPLQGKTAVQKENILRRRALAELPLPQETTPSEKKIVEKLIAELGLPPEPKTEIEKERFRKAQSAGLVIPLEGKSHKDKEKILRDQAAAGIRLPTGRTPSEKSLIKKIKAATPKQTLSEKLRHAKDAGLLTPLEGKPNVEKEKILKGLAQAGIPLPEPKSPSEKELVRKIRQEVGLPPEPTTASLKERMRKAEDAGIITPLEGKTPEEKVEILNKIFEAKLPLPEGRTKSEKSLIKRVKAGIVKIPSEKMREAKAAGLLTPLQGKTPEQKKRIIKELAKRGLPLPDGKSPSEKKLIKKIRYDMGLPEPKTPSEKIIINNAMASGLVTPLEGKTPEQKEKILKSLAKAGVPLPEGRNSSEKALIKKIQAEIPKQLKIPSTKLRAAKTAGLLTPLAGKSRKQQENILKGLAKMGLPLPEGNTDSEKNLIQNVRKEIGLPPEPKTRSEKIKMANALATGLVTPLEGKTPGQKEKILRRLAEAGVPLPEGRTPSERALVKKVETEIPPTPKLPSKKIRAAEAAGFLTPLEGKSIDQKEKILKGLAKTGLPLPDGKTSSEKNLIRKVRKEMGLPPEPKTQSEKIKMANALATGLVTPLEGKPPEQKEKVLRRLAEAGVPLPEGRTPSEKALVKKVETEVPPIPKVPSEKIRAAKAAGFLTPLEGKTPDQKEKILKGLAKTGLPLPDGKSPSEKNLITKVRKEMGLPPEPKTRSEKIKMANALATGLVTPLEGKTSEQKEKVLRRLAEAGVPLPEGRTPSEKALVKKVETEVPSSSKLPSEKIRAAKAAGFLTPLEGKTPDQKEKILKGLVKTGLPLPEGKTSSEKNLIRKVRKEMGLPPEPKTRSEKIKMANALATGLITPLEGKAPEQKEKVLRRLAEAGVPLPEGRTPSEKALVKKVETEVPSSPKLPSEKIRAAKAAGFLTPLEGKTRDQKEKILKGLANSGIPLPEGKSKSDKSLINKVRKDIGLPPEPKTRSEKINMSNAFAAGIVTPLEGKSSKQKEEVLRRLAEAGIILPEGRTGSEKALIKKIKAEVPIKSKILSKDLRAAKEAGYLTPLAGKSPAEKEKILKGLAMSGIPLPEPTTTSEKKLVKKIINEIGLPPEPKTPSGKVRMDNALAAGIITPLEGKTPEQKKQVLKRLADAGIDLPEGRTPSEKALINNIRSEMPIPLKLPSAKIRAAKAAGLLTPLDGKTAEQKEKIIRGLATSGMPLPEGKTASQKQLIGKVIKDLGLPPTPKTHLQKVRLNNALAAGIVTPLEGKTRPEKEKVLRNLAEAGVQLPDGRTASEKSIIKKLTSEFGPEPSTASEIIKKAKKDGILTPLQGKSKNEKEKIIKSLIKSGLPIPEGTTPSEKKLIRKLRVDAGLSPEATPSELKHKIKTKSKKIGVRKSKGITEEFEDIVKTNTCDKGCGCDKKKIRFKHSYVKIRVTSPDFSSICPCPEECVPQIKHGVIADNEGIKVTVGTALFYRINKEKSKIFLPKCKSKYMCSNSISSLSESSSNMILKIENDPYEKCSIQNIVYLLDRLNCLSNDNKSKENCYCKYETNDHITQNTGSSLSTSITISTYYNGSSSSSIDRSSCESISIAKTESSLSLRSDILDMEYDWSSESNLSYVDSNNSIRLKYPDHYHWYCQYPDIYSMQEENSCTDLSFVRSTYINTDEDSYTCQSVTDIRECNRDQKIVLSRAPSNFLNQNVHVYRVSLWENTLAKSKSRQLQRKISKKYQSSWNDELMVISGFRDNTEYFNELRSVKSDELSTSRLSSVFVIISSDDDQDSNTSCDEDPLFIDIDLESDGQWNEKSTKPCIPLKTNFIASGVKLYGFGGTYHVNRIPNKIYYGEDDDPNPCILKSNHWNTTKKSNFSQDKPNLPEDDLLQSKEVSCVKGPPKSCFDFQNELTDTIDRPCCCENSNTNQHEKMFSPIKSCLKNKPSCLPPKHKINHLPVPNMPTKPETQRLPPQQQSMRPKSKKKSDHFSPQSCLPVRNRKCFPINQKTEYAPPQQDTTQTKSEREAGEMSSKIACDPMKQRNYTLANPKMANCFPSVQKKDYHPPHQADCFYSQHRTNQVSSQQIANCLTNRQNVYDSFSQPHSWKQGDAFLSTQEAGISSLKKHDHCFPPAQTGVPNGGVQQAGCLSSKRKVQKSFFRQRDKPCFPSKSDQLLLPKQADHSCPQRQDDCVPVHKKSSHPFSRQKPDCECYPSTEYVRLPRQLDMCLPTSLPGTASCAAGPSNEAIKTGFKFHLVTDCLQSPLTVPKLKAGSKKKRSKIFSKRNTKNIQQTPNVTINPDCSWIPLKNDRNISSCEICTTQKSGVDVSCQGILDTQDETMPNLDLLLPFIRPAKPCECKKCKYKKKKVDCECHKADGEEKVTKDCPCPTTEDNVYCNDFEWFNENYIESMRSDLSTKKSGLKFDIVKKLPVTKDKFEDHLLLDDYIIKAYQKLLLENAINSDEDCYCAEKLDEPPKNKRITCECPLIEPFFYDDIPIDNADGKGLKIGVEAKGSVFKGFECCIPDICKKCCASLCKKILK